MYQHVIITSVFAEVINSPQTQTSIRMKTIESGRESLTPMHAISSHGLPDPPRVVAMNTRIRNTMYAHVWLRNLTKGLLIRTPIYSQIKDCVF